MEFKTPPDNVGTCFEKLEAGGNDVGSHFQELKYLPTTLGPILRTFEHLRATSGRLLRSKIWLKRGFSWGFTRFSDCQRNILVPLSLAA
jgi:hypothetical protein